MKNKFDDEKVIHHADIRTGEPPDAFSVFLEKKPFTQEEIQYRRGYIHGFTAGRETDTSMEEVKAWRYSDESTAPPGSFMAGFDFGDGIRKQ
jgi:hypothetical protein